MFNFSLLLSTRREGDSQKNYLQKQEKINALDQEIDQMVYKLYDLTPEEIKIVEEKG